MVAWRMTVAGSLPVTLHGRMEIISAICRACFTSELSEAGMHDALQQVDEDFTDGHLHRADLLWRAALRRAVQLTREHTPKIGTRAADVLHVACALELKLRHFLTFDDRQAKLAVAAGLKLVKL
jgi:predicted nucleic acid-binding protein